MDSKRILFVVHRSHTNLEPVREALEFDGWEVLAAVSKTHSSERQLRGRTTLFSKEEKTLPKVLAFLRDTKPRLIVHRQFEHGMFRFYVAALLLGIPVVGYSQREVWVGHSGRFGHSLVKDVVEMSISVLLRLKGQPLRVMSPVLSRERKRWKQPGYSWVPFPVPKAQNQSVGISLRVPRLLVVGKLDQVRKRQDWVVRFLEETNLQVEVDFVGTFVGDRDTLRNNEHFHKWKKRLERLDRRIRWGIHFDLNETEMSVLYEQASVLVLPARSEAWSAAAMEALGHGLPVVIASDSGNRHQVESSQSGLVFDVDSYSSFSMELAKIIESASLRRTLATNARLSQDIFSPQRFRTSFYQFSRCA